MKKWLWLMLLFVLLSACNRTDKKFKQARQMADELLHHFDEPSALSYFNPPYFNPQQMLLVVGTIKQNCDWKNRSTHHFAEELIEDKVDGSTAIFIYQYYMDCDSIQINMTYNLLNKQPQLIAFDVIDLNGNR